MLLQVGKAEFKVPVESVSSKFQCKIWTYSLQDKGLDVLDHLNIMTFSLAYSLEPGDPVIQD